ncbi:radical SAM protein [uncultured Treponema sp.]|uniref:radical SAM protein n=1 Tax=uncultured Treponema sp. TaxID=162155 RepID=UPI00258FCF6B|nr:radical SAM protein [uncultured Treponema sp.]
MDASIIVTYRCPMRCKMCNIWANPTKQEEELKPEEYKKLPQCNAINVTGGEPFVRDDLEEIIKILRTKTKRIVISSSGYFDDRVIALFKKYPDLGIRISIEGLSQKNDDLRGRPGGFDKGLKTLLKLREMGVKDIGFGCTVSNNNSDDMLNLYLLAKELNMQFATAAFHNSFYFHKNDNKITNLDEVENNFKTLIEKLFKEKSPKSWARAYFNYGLINYIHGNKRLLPCEAGTENFFIDPFGRVLPCNGMEENIWFDSFGNIKDVQNFDEIWHSEKADKIREAVRNCKKNCWMIGTASPVIKKYPMEPGKWILKNKLRSLCGKPLCLDLPERCENCQKVVHTISDEKEIKEEGK